MNVGSGIHEDETRHLPQCIVAHRFVCLDFRATCMALHREFIRYRARTCLAHISASLWLSMTPGTPLVAIDIFMDRKWQVETNFS